MMQSDFEKIWNPFRGHERCLESYKLEYIAKCLRDSYTEETGNAAYAPCGIKVKIEAICERLIIHSGYKINYVDEIVVPQGHKYSAYCEGSYQRGFTDFTNKLVCIQSRHLTERVALAHETAHVLHDANFQDRLNEGDSPPWLESQYNNFARYLGLPDDIYTRRFHHWHYQRGRADSCEEQLQKILSHLVSEFEMPGFSVLLRGRDLGLISQATTDQFILGRKYIIPATA